MGHVPKFTRMAIGNDVPRSTFTFYLQTTIQPLYFMRYAQFYALAIFFMYRLWPRKGWASTSGIAVELARKAIPLVEAQSSSWSVRLYMIFCFVSSGDGKAIWVRTKTLTVCRAVKEGYHSIIHNCHAWRTGYYPWADICNLLWLRIYNCREVHNSRKIFIGRL